MSSARVTGGGVGSGAADGSAAALFTAAGSGAGSDFLQEDALKPSVNTQVVKTATLMASSIADPFGRRNGSIFQRFVRELLGGEGRKRESW